MFEVYLNFMYLLVKNVEYAIIMERIEIITVGLPIPALFVKAGL